ncbi:MULTISPECIES: hypothetical protein [unclassified Corynebacterium]|uniref:hypothetical protein n=1 Tax=unclassified Corynebacterium TaxID=2624378 RepID=UPI0030A888D4
MSASSAQVSKKGLRKAVLAAVLFVIAIVAVVWGRGGLPGNVFGSGLRMGKTESVRVIIGSEKRGFLEDERVRDFMADRGYELDIHTAGSREIAQRPDLTEFEVVFPSSVAAAEKIEAVVGGAVVDKQRPFYSPMAIATFEPQLQALEAAGIASEEQGTWRIDMTRYVEEFQRGTRWRSLPTADVSYPSNQKVMIRSTDIRTSNSAAMYLSIVSWVTNGGSIVNGQNQVTQAVTDVAPFFLDQGGSGQSSAGPFAGYLSQGMSAYPMVMVYEAQFYGRLMGTEAGNQVSDSMRLAYPTPTVNSEHVALALTDRGADITRLLADAPELQRIAAEHGFRTQDPSVFADVIAEKAAQSPPEFLDTTEVPDYDTLEQMIVGIERRYGFSSSPQRDPDGTGTDSLVSGGN